MSNTPSVSIKNSKYSFHDQSELKPLKTQNLTSFQDKLNANVIL